MHVGPRVAAAGAALLGWGTHGIKLWSSPVWARTCYRLAGVCRSTYLVLPDYCSMDAVDRAACSTVVALFSQAVLMSRNKPQLYVASFLVCRLCIRPSPGNTPGVRPPRPPSCCCGRCGCSRAWRAAPVASAWLEPRQPAEAVGGGGTQLWQQLPGGTAMRRRQCLPAVVQQRSRHAAAAACKACTQCHRATWTQPNFCPPQSGGHVVTDHHAAGVAESRRAAACVCVCVCVSARTRLLRALQSVPRPAPAGGARLCAWVASRRC